MINYKGISATAAGIRRRHQESDLFRLCRAMGILVVDHDTTMSVDDFKGLCLIQSRVPVILLNSGLKTGLKRVVLAHEIGHVVLHQELAELRGFHDFDLFGMKDSTEYEANVFAAELMLDTEEVLDLLNQDMAFFDAASTLGVPPELLDFKFRVLKNLGYAINPQMICNGDFLKKISNSY